MKRHTVLLASLSSAICHLSSALLLSAQEVDYAKLKAQAEQAFAAGSYAIAHDAYAKAKAMKLPVADARWVEFRLADTQWRAQAATQNADPTKMDAARNALDVLIRDIRRAEDHDRVWVEVQESLGDFSWTRRNSVNWGEAWAHYSQALDWWAGAKDIELARRRYLAMVWKMAKPTWADRYWIYGTYGHVIPMEVIENALKIAQSDDDKAYAHYLVAVTLRSQGGIRSAERIPEEFEAALKVGKTTDWYDDALYAYAEWAAGGGRVYRLPNGGTRQEPDYVKAVELWRRLLAEFDKGSTRYYDQAKSQLQSTTGPSVGVSLGSFFLPDSEIQYHLNWRNVKTIDIAIYKVDLPRDARFTEDTHQGNWIGEIDLGGREKVRSLSKETGDKGDYKPGAEMMRLDQKLPAGAYVIEAQGGGQKARDLILVTDSALVLKSSGRQALAYFCNSFDGSPTTGATVRLWERYYEGNKWHWRECAGQSGTDGVHMFSVTRNVNSSVELFAAAAAGDRQAFCASQSYYYGGPDRGTSWRIYAFPDRPAYRPGEAAQWKLIARQYDGAVYSTPVNTTIEYQIADPRGTKVTDGKFKLNAFGSAWTNLDLKESMPLGEYRVTFWDDGRHNAIGNATLFRLEEYKLPEFKVSVETPEEAGKKKTFLLGDTVEVNINADYYFGGPVSDATAEVLVYQKPFHHWWWEPRPYAWFYSDPNPYRHWGGGDQIIKRETLKTDASGKIRLTFDTPANTGQDFEYRIEARVTDASRREIVGNGTVRVTRQRYYVYPRPEHCIYRPQDKVTVNIKTIDANDQPVQAEGTVKVTRDYWYEIWIGPDGRDVKGEELGMLRRHRYFPPPPATSNEPPWRLKYQGYEHDDILTRTVKTSAEGEAEFAFTPEREGYYRIAWSSQQKDRMPITADATVWVATDASTDIGYHSGGLQIVVDKDTFRVGQKAPVMISASTSDRYVLFCVEGDELYSHQLVHIDGSVKLLQLSIEEKHVPNIFLSAAMVSDNQVFSDNKEVVVPPARSFIDLTVTADKAAYQPREEGTFRLLARDWEGKPLATEIALGLTDESVYYIQQDYAGDIRQFYFGSKRSQNTQLRSTFEQRQYIKLVPGAEKELIDERYQRVTGKSKRGAGYGGGATLRDGAEGEIQGLAFGAESDALARPQRAERRMLARKSSAMDRDKMSLGANMMVAAAPAAMEPMASEAAAAGGAGGGPGAGPAVTVRTDFRSTVLWQPNVMTDKDGKATVKVKFADSLTSWRATARAATAGNQFGISNITVRTRQPLIVRLQAPRFFVVGDTLTISAVMNNNTEKPMLVKPSLKAEGLTVTGIVKGGTGAKGEHGPIEVPATGEARVDWLVSVDKPGEARLQVTAVGKEYADAMEKTYTVHEHGISKYIAKSGKVRGKSVTVTLDLPKERKPGSTTMTVQVAPSMAVTMLDALPYLADYPYGCTEQTMSRFLPAAITARTLKDLGLKPEAVANKLFGGVEQETADKTHPKGPALSLSKGKQDLAKLDDMVKQGLDRLYGFQHADGGWGWWKEGESDHFMTAYVVWGLTLARNAGQDIRLGAVERATDWLDKELVEEETNYDIQAWMLHALAVHRAAEHKGEPSKFQAKAFENLWANKDRLNAYTRALLALSAHCYKYDDKAKILVDNLRNGVKVDSAPDVSLVEEGVQKTNAAGMATAHWGEDGIYWRWSDGGVEATAFALRALLAIDPKNDLTEPVSNWLIKNRRGAQWSNTRDTAIVVLALNDYLRVSGEIASGVEYDVLVNGKVVANKKISAEEILSAPSRFTVDPAWIKDGANEVRIAKKAGTGPLYFAASAEFFSQEEPVTPAGNEIFVRRQYYKIVGRPTLLKGYVYDREPLNDGDTVMSGDRVETVVTVEGKNNYEYLVFEDLKPAGLEAVEIRSGESLYAKQLRGSAVSRKFEGGKKAQAVSPEADRDESDFTGQQRWVYQELRDRKVALFIDKLPEGVWQMRYEMRAEIPGHFHALPVMGHAMYVPEIRCNGAEIRFSIGEKD